MIVKELFAQLGLQIDEAGFEKAEALFAGLHKGLFAILGGVVGVVGGLLELGRETANAGFEAAQAAQKLGVTTDALQELQFAARASGVSTEALETALIRMNRASYAAREGSLEAGRAFQGMVSVDDLKRKKPDELFVEIAEKISKIKDPAIRTGKAMTIFGRQAAEIIPLLNKGAEGIEELRQEAHAMGLVLSQETIEDAKEFKKYLREAGEELEALKFKIGGAVLKGLVTFFEWVGRVKKAFIAWKQAHLEAIMQTIKVALLALTSVLLVYIGVHAAAIAATIAGWVVAAATAVASAVSMAAAWIAANAPLILTAAAIFGLLLLLEDLYQFLTGGESVIGDAVNYFKAEFDGFWDFLKQFARWLVDVFFGDAILEQVDKAAKYLVEKLTAAWKTVKEFFSHPIDTVFGSSSPNAGFSPAASSPAASAALSVGAASAKGPTVIAPNMGVNINVNASPGMDAKEVAGHVRNELENWHAGKMREAAAGVP